MGVSLDDARNALPGTWVATQDGEPYAIISFQASDELSEMGADGMMVMIADPEVAAAAGAAPRAGSPYRLDAPDRIVAIIGGTSYRMRFRDHDHLRLYRSASDTDFLELSRTEEPALAAETAEPTVHLSRTAVEAPAEPAGHRCPTPVPEILAGRWRRFDDGDVRLVFEGEAAGTVTLASPLESDRGTFTIGDQQSDGGFPAQARFDGYPEPIHFDILTSRDIGDCSDLLITLSPRTTRSPTALRRISRWVRHAPDSDRCSRVVRDPNPPLNVRELASSRSPIIATLDNGTDVTAGSSSSDGRWISIAAPVQGWVWAASVPEVCQ